MNTSESTTMTEREAAIRLANRVLDTPNRDPDDDLSMMSRQFIRATEREASRWNEALEKAAKWHDVEAAKAEALMATYGPENDPEAIRHRMAGTKYSTHIGSAAAIRALKSPEPQHE